MIAEVETSRDEQADSCEECWKVGVRTRVLYDKCSTHQLDAMLRRDWLILEAHGQFCGCSAHAWMKILDDMTREEK